MMAIIRCDRPLAALEDPRHSWSEWSPIRDRNHHFDYGNAKFRTREIHRYNPLNPDRAQSLKLPSEVDRDFIRIVAGMSRNERALLACEPASSRAAPNFCSADSV